MTVKRYMKYQKPVTIAISFKDEVDPDGTIREGRTFQEYLQSLYFKEGEEHALPWVQPGLYRATVNEEEVLYALKKLSYGKAVGLDQLDDKNLREALKESLPLREKVAGLFEKWLNSDTPLPEHLKVARTVI